MGYDFAINGWQIFVLVLVPIVLVFNYVISELNECGDYKLSKIIIEVVFRAVILASILTIVFLTGSQTFTIKGVYSSSLYVKTKTNSIGVIGYFENTSVYLLDTILPFLIKVYGFSVATTALELLNLLLVLLLLRGIFDI